MCIRDRNKTSNLAENGFSNWKKLSKTLRYHENSVANKNIKWEVS